jgi:hypothetical protein
MIHPNRRPLSENALERPLTTIELGILAAEGFSVPN